MIFLQESKNVSKGLPLHFTLQVCVFLFSYCYTYLGVIRKAQLYSSQSQKTTTDTVRNVWVFELVGRGCVIVRERFSELQREEVDALKDRFVANCDLLIEARG